MAAKPLPSYKNPPVVEVAVGVQFEPIRRLRSVQLALLWQVYRADFPRCEEHAPLASVSGDLMENELPQIHVEFFDEPPPTRLWFLTDDGTELIQAQSDRFVHNWRRIVPGAPYPRYPHVRTRIAAEFEAFQRFLSDEELGSATPHLCEVTYVNRIDSAQAWQHHGQLGEILSVWSGAHSDDFLPTPADVQARMRYPIRVGSAEPVGTLTAVVQPARVARQAAYQLTISALVRPAGGGSADVISALDIGHEWVVRGFTSLTTPQMHQIWRRDDGETA